MSYSLARKLDQQSIFAATQLSLLMPNTLLKVQFLHYKAASVDYASFLRKPVWLKYKPAQISFGQVCIAELLTGF
ncbi:MAG: hypothetical protein CVV41_00190 [Candidatus Riflebacteria bacterium HGW-Riflebacteria-1]|jgi:hypothetical protein|nr:MAG: hypothetical protein CVV41_00190 [Candidatus Riflebacteria bacterium HGW-Riflebacteria-1]